MKAPNGKAATAPAKQAGGRNQKNKTIGGETGGNPQEVSINSGELMMIGEEVLQ